MIPRRSVCLLLVSLFCYDIAAHASSGAVDPEAAQKCNTLTGEDFAKIEDAPTQLVSATIIQATAMVPEYCKVIGYISPMVGFLLALPTTTWNRKFIEGGCGGHCGVLEEFFDWGCGAALRKGYACVVSDMGHRGTGSDGLWAYRNLEAKIDWGYRATHVTALAGRAVATRFYGKRPVRSYFAGCSTGGRQGLQEAQRFPWDFDGIIAGAPPVNLSTVYMTFAWGIRVAHDEAGRPLLDQHRLRLITDAVISQCDLDDGVRDGIVGDPLNCRFDPSTLACRPGQHSEDCLSADQVAAVKRIYAGPMNSKGERLSPGGPLPGSEYGTWNQAYLSGGEDTAGYERLVVTGMRYLFFWPEPDRAWTLRDFDFDRDPQRMGLMEVLYDSSSPDLRKFKDAGGKLLVYQGANDNSVLPRSTVDYYEEVERTMGGRDAAQSFLRLFVLPGVEHCAGGPGADTVDYLSYLEQWVEQGRAPDELIAAHMKEPYPVLHPPSFPLTPNSVAFTRPIYVYPRRTHYRGYGDPASATNFSPVGPDSTNTSDGDDVQLHHDWTHPP